MNNKAIQQELLPYNCREVCVVDRNRPKVRTPRRKRGR